MSEPATIVVDASTMVELLLGTDLAADIRASLIDRSLATPAHFDVEVMSAIGRLERAGEISASDASRLIDRLVAAPIRREPLTPLLSGAWNRRADTRLADALYIELAESLDTVVVTTDQRLARTHATRTFVPRDQTTG